MSLEGNFIIFNVYMGFPTDTWVVPNFFSHGQGYDEIHCSNIFVNLSDLLRTISKIELGSSEVWGAAPTLLCVSSCPCWAHGRLHSSPLIWSHAGSCDLLVSETWPEETWEAPRPRLWDAHDPFSRLCTPAYTQGDVPALGCLSAGVLEGLQKNLLLPSRHPPTHLHGNGAWGKW